MRRFLSLFLLFFSLQVIGQEKVIFNDENIILRDLADFQSVVVRGPFKVYYSTDPDMQVAVSANTSAARDRIVTKVTGGTLHVSLDDNGFKWWGSKREFKVYITAPILNSLIASGAVNLIVVDEIKSTTLSLNLSGASDFSGKVVCDELKANLSGASDIKISGKAQKMSLVCTGASSFKGLELRVAEADVVATGASSIKITATESLKAKASGASSVQHKGNPRIYNQAASGASSIKNIN